MEKVCNVIGAYARKIYTIKNSLIGQNIYHKQYLRWTKHLLFSFNKILLKVNFSMRVVPFSFSTQRNVPKESIST